MFRHKKNASEDDKKTLEAPTIAEKVEVAQPVLSKAVKDVSPEALRELLEKNLKWSQIIYEQNRRINSKMFWYAFSGWARVVIILVPLILAAVFLPPYIGNVWNQYQNLIGSANILPKDASSNTLEQILQLLPLDAAKQEQVKTILK